MTLCATSLKYHSYWKDSSDPKLIHLEEVGKEVSQYPQLMNSSQEYAEIVYLCEGDAEYRVEGRPIYAKEGSLLLFNPGVIRDQRKENTGAVRRYHLAVKGLRLPGVRENCLLPDQANPLVDTQNLRPSVQSLFELMFAQLQQELLGSERTVHYLMMALLEMVKTLSLPNLENLEPKKEEPPLLVRIREYLDQHFTQELSLQSLAEQFHISSFYLGHLFKEQFGYPPVQYILRKRIGLAQTMLINTELPVGEIGVRVGYSNHSHFNLIFTKNVGISPRKYRMNYKN